MGQEFGGTAGGGAMIFPVPSQRFCGACDVLLSFAAASADAGAVMAIAFNGAGVPLASVERGPFRSFLGPGIILGGCVSGTHLVAALALA